MSDLDHERQVLGAMLSSSKCIGDVRGLLVAEDFNDGRARLIYDAILRVADAGLTPDPTTVADELGDDLDGVGGHVILHELMAGIVTADNVGHHAEIVAEAARRRAVLHGWDEYDRTGDAESLRAALDALDALQAAEGTGKRSEALTRLVDGGTFILDQPDRVPAIWGSGNAVLWAEGEALTICGPAGVGKTTVAGQVVRARVVGGDVLGYPVEPTTSRVLYLAMDRPRQIARALRRNLADVDRDVLAERLVFWPGPPLADIAKHPAELLGLARLAGADTVIVDSLKDAAVGLSDDEVGAGYNRARQMCLAEGVEVVELHHMVKKGANGAAPTSLADLYGSTWIGAGSGSVVLLWGSAGDPIVELRHLKQPAEEVGPFRVVHDHDAGTSSVWQEDSPLAVLKAAGEKGITAKALAGAMYDAEKPTPAQRQKARRKLERLEREGNATMRPGDQTNSIPDVWVFVDPFTEPSRSPNSCEPFTNPSPLHESGQNRRSDPSRDPSRPSRGGPFTPAHPPVKGGAGESAVCAVPNCEESPTAYRIDHGHRTCSNHDTKTCDLYDQKDESA